MANCHRHCLSAPVVALHVIILPQLLFALFAERGEFVRSENILISPFHFCMRSQGGEMACHSSPNSLLRLALGLMAACVYAPVALLMFTIMAYLFALCYDDKKVLWWSVAGQYLSSGLMVFGLTAFIVNYWNHIQLTDLTLAFHFTTLSCAEIMAAAALSNSSGKDFECKKSLTYTMP
ncbi:hypothetical protein AGOR_G00248650 [Albula goreensis]|uniref:Uncharacterized protein n=1 Tax=Albula goreensis TaxID=1534307 RepID=A0A8T3CEG2_9TELE|nr:hypothetical protein AGOR_G00248650 [Albula goreensis]